MPAHRQQERGKFDNGGGARSGFVQDYQEGLTVYKRPEVGEFLHHYLFIKNTLTEVVRGEQEQALRELYALLLHTISTNAGFEVHVSPGEEGRGTQAAQLEESFEKRSKARLFEWLRA